MDSTNRKLAGFSVIRRFGATLSLFATLALAACNFGPAAEGDDDVIPEPNDGVGTSPSDPDPDPTPDPPPPPPSGKRVAQPNDPSGCAAGTVVIVDGDETTCWTFEDLRLR